MDMVVRQFEVWLVNLEPTLGNEINKTRPCLVISPDVVNKYLNTITVAAMTSAIKPYPTRVTCVFQKHHGQVALDQIRSVDKIRLIKKLGVMDKRTCGIVCDVLAELFKQ
jgi:mRNA interferase MazF